MRRITNVPYVGKRNGGKENVTLSKGKHLKEWDTSLASSLNLPFLAVNIKYTTIGKFATNNTKTES